MKKILSTVLFALPLAAFAAGNVQLDKAPVDVNNERSLQRGAQIFVNNCMGCHGMKYLRYSRMAKDLGLTEKQVKENLMFGDVSFGSTMEINMPADQSKQWFGSPPPDLTLTARARGADWVYTYLRSFYAAPDRTFGVNNVVLPGASMPHVLESMQGLPTLIDDGQHHGDDHGEATAHGNDHADEGTYKVGAATFKLASEGSMSTDEYDRYVGDLTNFMVYAAEPIQKRRRELGTKVMFFLFIFFIMAWLLNREYWKDIK